MNGDSLLRVCVARLGAMLDTSDEATLRRWWEAEHARNRPFVAKLLSLQDSAWEAEIDAHAAHRHPFYDMLAHDFTVQEYASFLLENWAYPSFLALVEKTLAVQPTAIARDAILRNIADEHVPVPHADLMRRLFLAVKTSAGSVPIAMYPSLSDRTLVFYYGYFCEPWNLVGSLYATEVMAHYRMLHMGRGLERLGFPPEDREYIRIHLQCDDDHARDWRQDVIASSVAANQSLRQPIAEGIASCLETSGRYLDDLVTRARAARVPRAGSAGAHDDAR